MILRIFAAVALLGAVASYAQDYWEEDNTPCAFWNGLVHSNTGSFDWRRSAQYHCHQFHDPNRRGEVPEELEAGMRFLDDYVLQYEAVQANYLKTLREVIAAKEDPYNHPRLLEARLNPDALAEETGLLVVLEELNDGY